MGGDKASYFEGDRRTPKRIMCEVFSAWECLLTAAQEDVQLIETEPFRYDFVYLGREVLAQISTPIALNFSKAIHSIEFDIGDTFRTGLKNIELLNDLDDLVATDEAFLLGHWLQSARQWGRNSTDCSAPHGSNCEDFYEWNARTQITTWNPTSKDSPSIPGGPIDYAAKHWSGLIKDYYVRRIKLLLRQALEDQTQGRVLNQTKADQLLAQHAYDWTTYINPYPTHTTGDPVKVSLELFEKYREICSACNTYEISSVA